MSLGTYLEHEKSILGCELGWTVKKGLGPWADYEQLLRPFF